jgi:hypothetical protein
MQNLGLYNGDASDVFRIINTGLASKLVVLKMQTWTLKRITHNVLGLP